MEWAVKVHILTLFKEKIMCIIDLKNTKVI